jgi:hypothetical protein
MLHFVAITMLFTAMLTSNAGLFAAGLALLAQYPM